MPQGLGYYSGLYEGKKLLQDMQIRAEDQEMQKQRFPALMEQDALALQQGRQTLKKGEQDLATGGLEQVEKQITIRKQQNELAKQEYELNLIRNMQSGTAVPSGLQTQAQGDQQLAEQNRKMGTALMRVDPLKAKSYFDAANTYESAAAQRIKTSLEIKQKQVDQAGQILANVDSQETLNQALPELAANGIVVPPEFREWKNPKTRDWITRQALRSPTIAKDLQDQVGFLDDQDKLAIDRQKNEIIDEEKYNKSLRERTSQIKATTGAGSKQSAINERFNDRVINAGRLATEAIDNIAQLPLEKTSFGGFKTEKMGLLDATKDALVTKLTPADNQIYDKLMAGVERNLATLETFGIAPPVSFAKSFEALKAKPGETVKTRLINLAEMRQIIDTSLSGFLDKPNIPEKQKIAIREMLDKTKAAVPYTVDDIIALDSKDTNFTLGNMIREEGTGKVNARAYEDAEKEKRYQTWKAEQERKKRGG